MMNRLNRKKWVSIIAALIMAAGYFLPDNNWGWGVFAAIIIVEIPMIIYLCKIGIDLRIEAATLKKVAIGCGTIDVLLLAVSCYFAFFSEDRGFDSFNQLILFMVLLLTGLFLAGVGLRRYFVYDRNIENLDDEDGISDKLKKTIDSINQRELMTTELLFYASLMQLVMVTLFAAKL